MNRNNPLDLCIEYIHQIWCMEDLKEGGMFAVYGMEQHRIELHDMLCSLLEIDREKSKEILSYLDKKLDMDFSTMPSESDLRNYGQKLLDILLNEKKNGTL